jgi:hypothetical protein
VAARRRLPTLVATGLLAAVACLPAARAQSELEQRVNQFWPEGNAFVTLSDNSRLFLLVSVARAREFATSTETSYGLHYDYFAARLPSWWLDALPNMERDWSLWFRFGYNRVEALGGPGDENRLLVDATLRSIPLSLGLQVANRSRVELRDIEGDTSWRYRNRSRVERGFTTLGLFGERIGAPLQARFGLSSVTPYAMVEYTWDSRVSTWNRRYQQYGVEFELGRTYGVEVYVGVQDERRASRPSVVAVGTVLTIRY